MLISASQEGICFIAVPFSALCFFLSIGYRFGKYGDGIEQSGKTSQRTDAARLEFFVVRNAITI